jgi:hypothetical protein
MDETMEVGCDVGEPVSPDYGPRGNEFSGKIKWVQIDIDAAGQGCRPHDRRRRVVQPRDGPAGRKKTDETSNLMKTMVSAAGLEPATHALKAYPAVAYRM